MADALEVRGYGYIDDVNGAERSGYGRIPMSNTPSGRVSAAHGYLTRSVRQRPNLRILGDTTVTSVVLDDKKALTNRSFVEGFDVRRLEFDPDEMRRRWRECAADEELYLWPFEPFVMDRFRTPARDAGEAESSELVMQEVAG